MGLKILFSSRSNLHQQVGGDTLHLEQTAQALEKIGHSVEIYKKGIDPQDFDLIHHFNLGRPYALLKMMPLQKPLFISSIYVDYRAADLRVSKIRRILSLALGSDAMEYLKLMARVIKGKEGWPGWFYFFHGQRASVLKVLKQTRKLILASQAEAQLIKEHYGFDGPIEVLKLGLEHLPLAPSQDKSGVLCIARFENLKNQLALIEASQNQDWELNLIGEASPGQEDYRQKCLDMAGAEVHFHNRKSLAECLEFYRRSKVHVLPSFYESTGLVSLEALASGCQIVVSDLPIQRELFGERAFYCDPTDPSSIQKAIASALAANTDHSEWVRANFSWQKAAQALERIYQD